MLSKHYQINWLSIDNETVSRDIEVFCNKADLVTQGLSEFNSQVL